MTGLTLLLLKIKLTEALGGDNSSEAERKEENGHFHTLTLINQLSLFGYRPLESRLEGAVGETSVLAT